MRNELMKFFSVLSVLLVASVISFEASAGPALVYDHNMTSTLGTELTYKVYSQIDMSPEMMNQVQNVGCIPRGTLIPDSYSTLRLQVIGGILPKGGEFRAQFTLCEDPLSLILPFRVFFEMTGSALTRQGKNVSLKNTVQVSITSPSGLSYPFRHQIMKQSYGPTYHRFESNGGVNAYGIASQRIGITEGGVYELLIKNPTTMDIEANFDLILRGSIVP